MREIGDILEASVRNKNAGLHYIIFYSGYDEINFLGAMITHLKSERNELMSIIHFESTDENGDLYKVQFDDTYLVKAKLMKLESWGPFKKVGQLTQEGINFVKEKIENSLSETWDEYLVRTA